MDYMPNPSLGKEIRGGENEKAAPESSILTRSAAHRQAHGNSFHGFKSRGKVKGSGARQY
jgi:hypothetical protein